MCGTKKKDDLRSRFRSDTRGWRGIFHRRRFSIESFVLIRHRLARPSASWSSHFVRRSSVFVSAFSALLSNRAKVNKMNLDQRTTHLPTLNEPSKKPVEKKKTRSLSHTTRQRVAPMAAQHARKTTTTSTASTASTKTTTTEQQHQQRLTRLVAAVYSFTSCIAAHPGSSPRRWRWLLNQLLLFLSFFFRPFRSFDFSDALTSLLSM